MSNIFSSGFNLPPSCSVNDIPGNSPEDAKWEQLTSKFWGNKENCTDELWEKFAAAKLEDDLMDIVDKAIEYGIDYAEKSDYDDYEASKEFKKLMIEDLLKESKVPQTVIDGVLKILDGDYDSP